MLGIYISGPIMAFAYAIIASVITCILSLVWYKFSYHDEEDDREWNEDTAFKMKWESDLDPDK